MKAGWIQASRIGAAARRFLQSNRRTEAEDSALSGYVVVPDTSAVAINAGAPEITLVPTLTVVRDIDERDGFFDTFALGHSFTLTDQVSLELRYSTETGNKESSYEH